MKRAEAAQRISKRPEKGRDPRLVCVASEATLADLPTVVRDIARLCDGDRDSNEILQASQIPETKCRAVIKKLTALGILQPESFRKMIPEQPFSAAEEAFFAAEIPPIDECDEPFEPLGDRIRAAVCETVARLRRHHVLG